jgi:hypothetical protein
VSGAGQPVVAEESIGPLDVAPGEEKTVCIVKRLDNEEDAVITSLSAELAPGSHHLVAYRTMAATEAPTPAPCRAFADVTSSGAAPILFANRAHLAWSFPSGVGLRIAAHQMIRIEAHYINTGSAALAGSAKVSFRGTPVSSAPPWESADVLFWGTTRISIPPHGTSSTGPLFQGGIAGTRVLSITTHEHRLGTRVQVWSSVTEAQRGRVLADDQNWAEPSWRTLDPPVDFDGASGLSYQCDWSNTTDTQVSFGESALEEMCFVAGYYYPAHALDVCLDGRCLNRQR